MSTYMLPVLDKENAGCETPLLKSSGVDGVMQSKKTIQRESLLKTPFRDISNARSSGFKKDSALNKPKMAFKIMEEVPDKIWPEPEYIPPEDNYQDNFDDILPKHERFSSDDIYYLVNFWEKCRKRPVTEDDLDPLTLDEDYPSFDITETGDPGLIMSLVDLSVPDLAELPLPF